MMRKRFFCMAAAGLVAATLSAGAAQAAPLFRADFEDGKTDGWSAIGSGDIGLTSYQGNVSLKLTGPIEAIAAVSTADYTNISVSYSFAASGLADGDACLGEVWDDGVTLHKGGGTAPSIDDNGNVRIRVRAASHGGTCRADNIMVTGRRRAQTALPQAFDAGGARRLLTIAELTKPAAAALPVSFSAFTPPSTTQPMANRFEGRLVLAAERAPAGVRIIRDDYGDFKSVSSPARHLPPFDFAFVQSGNALIPVRRGAIPSTNPEWEFILEPGRVWDEKADQGYSRASLPFTLEERNANCMHHGVLAFLFKNGGVVSNVVYEIGSETCLYSKFDLWGTLAARYVPGKIPHAAEIAADYRSEIAHRLPTKPIVELAKDYPGIDPQQFGAASEIDPDDMTTYGLVVNGVNYVGGCDTRFGAYPYCAQMDLPSYSLAKSIFAGEASMRLELLYPGVMRHKIADYVPACAAAGSWDGVTFENALDMATGHYQSAADQADEDAPDILPFFLADTHKARVDFACMHYPRKAKPGTLWVYHTTDTYVLGTALRAFYRSMAGTTADFYKDVLVDPIFHGLHLNPAIDVTRRSYDAMAEPFTGWGLTLHRDDIAKIADFLNVSGGKIAGKEMLDPTMLAAALQRDPNDPGLTASTQDLRYNDGFWAWNAQAVLGCAKPTWIPFMSGYGGIVVAMMPNGITYYYVSDGGAYKWAKAAAEADKLASFCER